MKKVIILLFSLFIALPSVWAVQYDFSAVVPSGQTLFFKIESSGVSVVSQYSQYSQYSVSNYDSNNRPSGSLVIPSSISNGSSTYSVVSIGAYAFRDCVGLTSVTIPNTVTSIGRNAFAGCTGLTSMTIPNSVTAIDGAFVGCENLISVVLPNTISSIDGAFSGCGSLTTISIPSSVTTIGFMTFYDCASLQSITLPHGVTTIADNAFRGCSNLTSIVVDSGNSFFDSRDNCNAIIETASNSIVLGCGATTIPSTVTAIGEYAFSGCDGLGSMTIPDNVNYIGKAAFKNCANLTRVEVLGDVTTLNALVFDGCVDLEYLSLPSTITSIHLNALRNCSDIDSIMLHSTVPPVLVHKYNEDKLYLRGLHGVTFFVPCGAYQSYYNTWALNQEEPYTIVFDSASGNTIYEPDTNYSLRLLSNDSSMGAAEIVATEGNYYSCADSIAIIQAVSNQHYHFEHWSNGSIANPDTISLVCDTVLTAYFAINNYSVTLQGGEGIAVLSGDGVYPYGTEVTVTANVISDCHTFVSWNVGENVVSNENTYTFVVDDDIELTAVFDENVYESEEYMTVCDSLTWHGVTYTSSGSYTFETTSAMGCDSVVYLHLTVNPSVEVTIADTTDSAYTWNGNVYTESGIYQWLGQTVQGCDSIVTLFLTIDHNLLVNVFDDETDVIIYPNPTSGKLTVEIDGFMFAELYNQMGVRLCVYNNSNNIDLTGLPSGVYLLGMYAEGYKVKRKIILQ